MNPNSEAREREARAFFSWFSKGIKPFHIGTHTTVGCLETVSVCLCVSQHFFRPRLSTALNLHGTKEGQSRRILRMH